MASLPRSVLSLRTALNACAGAVEALRGSAVEASFGDARLLHSSASALFARRRAGGPAGAPDPAAGPDGKVDQPGSNQARRRQGSREEVSSAPYESEAWTYTLTDIPPDNTASRLSDQSKEAMYARHKEDPATWTAARLAKEYRIREQRAHAILWLKELEKKAEAEQGEPLDDSVAKLMEERLGTVHKAAREQHVSIFPSAAVDAIDDEDERVQKLLEESAREEVFKVEEFVRTMSFNKLQMSSAVKVSPLSRRRPPEGWSYVVEELGEEGRRGRAGGRRYVVGPDGAKRGLNEQEKMFLDREKVRPRRRIVP